MEMNFVEAWAALGQKLMEKPDRVELAKVRSVQQNPWFTADHINFALDAVIEEFFNQEKLNFWIEKYEIKNQDSKQHKIGVICAGNLPMVGLHDIICILTAGHHALIKLSHKDQFLIPALLESLAEIEPATTQSWSIVNRLDGYDAVIATGSNNSLRYFESYFGHVPHVFRSNRTSVGVLHADDGNEILEGLAKDIFMHFGLGCRNVSKLYIPSDFDLNKLFEATLSYSQYAIHSKYRNNFTYHSALFQMNKVDYLTNDLFILLETEELHSPLSIVYFEYYENETELVKKINAHADEIQAVYSSKSLGRVKVTVPGTGQKPALWDYADNIDVMEWLAELKNVQA